MKASYRAVLAGVLALALPGVAAAQQNEARPDDPMVDTTPTLRSWSEGTPRLFAASLVDVGFLYLRPRAALGYGKPHSSWFGLELNPLFVSSGVGAYGGIRGALPFLDIRAGVRGYYAFEHSYLAPAASYSRLDLETSLDSGHAQTITYETELSTSFVAGPGEISGLASLSTVTGVPADRYVFEETLHIIAKRTVWRARAGYAFFVFPSLGRISAGPVVDVLGTPGHDGLTVRAGIVARVILSRNLEVRGTFVPTVASPDRIGLVGGDFTELGLRYRWASGS